LFLLPSQTESFGLAALEAMAARTPVISTNAGGLPEVNLHGITGFLSDVGNIDEMAKNALLILKNDEILNKFKDKAKSHSEKFTLNHILPQYIKIYESVLKEKVNCL
jgi:glycosyltransferase involved in cell wall biosynthesis